MRAVIMHDLIVCNYSTQIYMSMIITLNIDVCIWVRLAQMVYVFYIV